MSKSVSISECARTNDYDKVVEREAADHHYIAKDRSSKNPNTENPRSAAWFCMVHFKITLVWTGHIYRAYPYEFDSSKVETSIFFEGEDPLELIFKAVKHKAPEICLQTLLSGKNQRVKEL